MIASTRHGDARYSSVMAIGVSSADRASDCTRTTSIPLAHEMISRTARRGARRVTRARRRRATVDGATRVALRATAGRGRAIIADRAETRPCPTPNGASARGPG
jgi:hypothetical protein